MRVVLSSGSPLSNQILSGLSTHKEKLQASERRGADQILANFYKDIIIPRGVENTVAMGRPLKTS